MTSQHVTVPTPDGEMPAHLWLPESGRGPGLVLVQEIFGVSDYIQRRGADLAALGYVVLAPELYWRIGSPKVEPGDDMIEQGMALAQQADWASAVADGALALTALRDRPEVSGGVGLIGFCYGGGLAFNVAAGTSPDVLVSYYGSALPDLLHLADKVTCPQLHHFGDADSFLDTHTVARIRAALEGSDAEVEVEIHPGADHAFDNDEIPLHHAEASARAWEQTVDFLGRRLPVA